MSNESNYSKIQESHGSEHENYCLLGCDTRYSTRKIPTFWKIELPVSSWKKKTKNGTTDTDGVKGRAGTGVLTEPMGVRGTV
jgi:hypothetical protein